MLRTIITIIAFAVLVGCTCEPPPTAPRDAGTPPDDAACIVAADFCDEIDTLRATTWPEPDCSPGAPSPLCPWRSSASCCDPALVEQCRTVLRYATEQGFSTCTDFDYRLLTVCDPETCR